VSTTHFGRHVSYVVDTLKRTTITKAGPRAFSLTSLITQRHAADRHDRETGRCWSGGTG